MKNIGIVGSGIAGLQLALFLQKHGIDATLYSDKTPDQIRACRLGNTVARYHTTRERERWLGVEHWDYPDFGVFGGSMYIGGEQPIIWSGSFKHPASSVDMRVYQSALLEDFEARGGKVVLRELNADDVVKLSDQHDLMVIASGRYSLIQSRSAKYWWAFLKDWLYPIRLTWFSISLLATAKYFNCLLLLSEGSG
jgi:flavin-dependent dehydrogenase